MRARARAPPKAKALAKGLGQPPLVLGKAKAKAKAKAANAALAPPPAKAMAAKAAQPALAPPPAKAEAAKAKQPALAPPPAKAKAATAKQPALAPPPAAQEPGTSQTAASASAPPAMELRLTNLPETLFCSTCKMHRPYGNCRLTAKKEGPKFKCAYCSTTTTQLYRGFGSWPPAAWSKVPEVEQARFYSMASTMSGKAVIDEALALIETYHKEEHFYEEGGAFLPLSVWDRKGFDINLIQLHSKDEDKQTHPVLGATFRVKILRTGNRGSQGNMTSDSHRMSGKAKAASKASAASEGDSKPRLLDDEEREAAVRGMRRYHHEALGYHCAPQHGEK